MKIVKISLITIAVIAIVTVVIINFSLNSIIKKGIEHTAPGLLGVNVTVNDVDISLLAGHAQISGLTVGNPKGFQSDKAFYLGKVDINLEPMSLFSDVILIHNIDIVEPLINYELGAGQTNIGTIEKNIKGTEKDSGNTSSANTNKEASSSKRVVIERLSISDAKVNAGIGKLAKEVVLPEIELKNIGKEGSSMSVVTATTKVISTIILTIAKTDITAVPGSVLQTIGDQGKSITDGLKGLFK